MNSSAFRCRIYYIFLCCSKRQWILKLHIRANDIRLKVFRPSNKLQWLVEFGRKAHARGDIVRNDHRLLEILLENAVRSLLLNTVLSFSGIYFAGWTNRTNRPWLWKKQCCKWAPPDKFRSVGICSVRGSALDAPASHCSLCSDVVRLESTTTHQLSQPLSQRC